MSIVCAAIKNNEVAIAADTQMSMGSLTVTAVDLRNCEKLFKVADSVMGVVGWKAMSVMLEAIIDEKSEIFELTDRQAIYKSVMRLHQEMKENYFLETSEYRSQPVESLQLHAMIVNASGIYEVNSYREVSQYERFWAIGSGREYSLGAMESLFEREQNALSLAEAGVSAAAKFDDACSLPITSEVIALSSSPRIVATH